MLFHWMFISNGIRLLFFGGGGGGGGGGGNNAFQCKASSEKLFRYLRFKKSAILYFPFLPLISFCFLIT